MFTYKAHDCGSITLSGFFFFISDVLGISPVVPFTVCVEEKNDLWGHPGLSQCPSQCCLLVTCPCLPNGLRLDIEKHSPDKTWLGMHGVYCEFAEQRSRWIIYREKKWFSW